MLPKHYMAFEQRGLKIQNRKHICLWRTKTTSAVLIN